MSGQNWGWVMWARKVPKLCQATSWDHTEGAPANYFQHAQLECAKCTLDWTTVVSERDAQNWTWHTSDKTKHYNHLLQKQFIHTCSCVSLHPGLLSCMSDAHNTNVAVLSPLNSKEVHHIIFWLSVPQRRTIGTIITSFLNNTVVTPTATARRWCFDELWKNRHICSHHFYYCSMNPWQSHLECKYEWPSISPN